MNISNLIMDIFKSLFETIWEWIVDPFLSLKGFEELIFGKDGDVKLAYGIFTTNEITDIFDPGIQIFFTLAIFAILIGIVIGGMKISSSGINPSNRNYLLEFFKDLVIVAIVLFNLPVLYHILFGLNYSIINLFHGEYDKLFELESKLEGQGVLGWLIINLSLLGLSLWANFYYMMRKLTLIILMIMGPLMIALYLLPQTKQITTSWFKELTGTVLVQSIHAAMYWIVATLSVSTSGVESVILYIIFIPVSEGLRSLIGLGGDLTNRFTRTAAMFGGAGLASIYGSVKGAIGGKSVMETLRGAYQGYKNNKNQTKDGDEEEKGILNNAGTDIGSTTKAERMLKAGEIFSKGGKAILGAAGGIAGAPLGPMGSMVGSTAGFNIGGVVGGVAGRTGSAVVEGIKSRVQSGINAFNKKKDEIENAEDYADEKLAKAIADEETTKWANENKDEFMKDLKTRFPDASDKQLSQIWDKELQKKKGEFLDKARQSIGTLKKEGQPHANANDLVDSTVDKLTEDWAKNNKDNFMQYYDQQNPLPENATNEEKQQHMQNRERSWNQAVDAKRNAIRDVAKQVASSLVKPSNINKNAFANNLGNELAQTLGVSPEKAKDLIRNAIGNNSTYGKANELVDTTVDALTDDWTKNNKEQFMKGYDTQNPLPKHATDEEIQQHNLNREKAWNKAFSQKKDEIRNIAKQTANNLTKPNAITNQELSTQISNDVAETLGIDPIQAKQIIENTIAKSNQNSVNPKDMVTSTVNAVTDEWASTNKESFMKNYDAENPLPTNATQEEIAIHNQNRESAWNNALNKTRNSIKEVTTNAIKKATTASQSQALISKEDFAKEMTRAVESSGLSLGNSQVENIIRNATGITPGNTQQFANKNDIVTTTVEELTNDWAYQNKDQFYKNYDNQNPLPANYTRSDVKNHQQQREIAWQTALSNKQQEISNAVTQVANQLSNNAPDSLAFISKQDFANKVGSNVSSIIGKNISEAAQIVQQATESVRDAALYSGSSVNRDFLVNRLAATQTNAGMEQFIQQGLENGDFSTRQEAVQHWQNVESPKRFQENLQKVNQTIPRQIPLDHRIIGQKGSLSRNLAAGISGAGAFVVGASGVNEISSFVADTKIGQAISKGSSAIYEELMKQIDTSQGVLTGTQEKIQSVITSGIQEGIAGYKNHVPQNVVEKQAGFRNAFAYAAGVVGGVYGYKKGANLAMKINPYNNQVNQQTAELSEIQHMVQTVTDNYGNTKIPDGAIRMVTTANQTVIQVRDKTGNVQTVSRISTGDSSLKDGQTIYQNLTIDNGQIVPVSNAYKEDSGGGRIVLDRHINIDPNKLVANRNTPRTHIKTTEVQSYNQFVDSGEYYLTDAIDANMSDFRMVIDRQKSYVVGKKDGKEYRISPYGPGDARLQPEEVVYRVCEYSNKKLRVRNTNIISGENVQQNIDYTSTLDPNDLIQPSQPNKRFLERQFNEKSRNPSLTESLR